MLECSVIILNWNGEAMLRRFLPSVIQYTQGEHIEIVVADNGSTDASIDFLRTQPVRIIELGENYGFVFQSNMCRSLVPYSSMVIVQV